MLRPPEIQFVTRGLLVHILADRAVKSCVLFDLNGTEHAACTVSHQVGPTVDVTVTGSLCLQEAVVVLSAEPSVRAISWVAPTHDVPAGGSFVLPIAPPCVRCMVHFGDQVLPTDVGGATATVVVPRSPTGPYLLWVNATLQPGLLSSRRGAVNVIA